MRALQRERPGLVNKMILHQDNAPFHTSAYTTDVVKELNIKTIKHSAYSPDLIPMNFHVFPELKKELRGIVFDSVEEIKFSVLDKLRKQSREWLQRYVPKLDS